MLVSHCFETECGNFETKLAKGSFLYAGTGEKRSKGIFFPFSISARAFPPKTVVPETDRFLHREPF